MEIKYRLTIFDELQSFYVHNIFDYKELFSFIHELHLINITKNINLNDLTYFTNLKILLLSKADNNDNTNELIFPKFDSLKELHLHNYNVNLIDISKLNLISLRINSSNKSKETKIYLILLKIILKIYY